MRSTFATRRARAGFTLIELLVTIVIIGILASIAITQMTGIKTGATRAAMISDLRNLAVVQERMYNANNTYMPNGTRTTDAAGIVTGTMGLAPGDAGATYAPSKRNVVTVTGGTALVWQARINNLGFPGAGDNCTIAVGEGLAGIPLCFGVFAQ